LLLLVPVTLALLIFDVREARRLVSVTIGNQASLLGSPASASKLLRRLSGLLPQHRFATSLLVRREKTMSPESGLNVADTETFVYARRARTLEFSVSWPTNSYGWIYIDVDEEDVRAAAQASGGATEGIYLPCVQSALLQGGCTLQKKFTP